MTKTRPLPSTFRILRRVATTDLGRCYLAKRKHDEMQLWLKVLHTNFEDEQEARRRLAQEGEILGGIRHPNVMGVVDAGHLEDSSPYLLLDDRQGRPLAELFATNDGLPIGQAISIIRQVCAGASALHENGIVHRDLKPANIWVGTDDAATIFTLEIPARDPANPLTNTGSIFGTPHYMPPEQCLGQAVDARADVYSIGVMLFELLTGSVPFTGESSMGILTQHITVPAPSPSELARKASRPFPDEAESIILRALAKEPGQRYPSALDLADELGKLSQ